MQRFFFIEIILGCLILFGHSSSYAKSLRYYKYQARRYYHRGARLAARQKYQQAIQEYLKALAFIKMALKEPKLAQHRKELIQSQATFNYILGRTCQFAKNYLQAYRYYKKCLQLNPKPKVLTQAQKYLFRVTAKIVTPIEFDTFPSGAMIILASKQGEGHIGKTPIKFQMIPGHYSVIIRLKGYHTIKTTLDVHLKKSEMKIYTLKPLVKPKLRKRRKIIIPIKPKKRKTPLPKIIAWSSGILAGMTLISGTILIGKAQGEFKTVNAMRGKLKYRNKIDEINQHVQTGNSLQISGVTLLTIGILSASVSTYFFLKPTLTKKRKKSNKKRENRS